MTANFNESGALGSVIAIAAQSEAGSDSTQTSNSTRRRIVNDGYQREGCPELGLRGQPLADATNGRAHGKVMR